MNRKVKNLIPKKALETFVACGEFPKSSVEEAENQEMWKGEINKRKKEVWSFSTIYWEKGQNRLIFLLLLNK